MTRRDLVRGIEGFAVGTGLLGGWSGASRASRPATGEPGATGGITGGAPLPSGEVAVTAQPFGAVGDGAHDDTAALRAALATGAPVVLLPPGTYLVSEAITIPTGTVVRGAGRQATVIRARVGGKWAAPRPSTWVYVLGAVNADDVTVTDLTVDVSGETASGIAVLGGDRPTITGCGVRNVRVHSGCHFFGAQSSGVRPVVGGVMAGNVVEGCVYNLVLDGQNEDCRLIGNLSLSPGVTHISMDGGQGGTGNHGIVVQGNVCQGQQGTSNGVVCFQTHGAAFGTSHENPQMQHRA